MKALTLWRPWPVAIFYLNPEFRKDVENRPKKPPQSVIGQRIAIHAGKYLEPEVFEEWLRIIEPSPINTFALLCRWQDLSRVQGIVGTVVVAGVCKPEDTDSPWATGPECLILSEPRPLREPILCKGKQGYWNVPSEIEARIKRLEICEVSIGK